MEKITDKLLAYNAEQLTKMGRQVACPFSIGLDNDAQALLCEKILRIVPGKRLVALAKWQGQPVIAKIFYQSTRASSHAYREQAGNQALERADILTPGLLYAGQDASCSVYVLIFHYIPACLNVTDIWNHPGHPEWLSVTQQVIGVMAALHEAGLLQRDPHPNNFLFNEQGVYTLDTGDFELKTPGSALQKKESLASLGCLFAQIQPAGYDKLKDFYRHYLMLRSWQYAEKEYEQLLSFQQKARQARERKIKQKALRNTSRFKQLQTSQYFIVVDREVLSPSLQHFFSDPVTKIHEGEIIDAGEMFFQTRMMFDGLCCAVSEYKAEHLWESILHRYQGSPARKAWSVAQYLKSYGLPIPQPIAFLEKESGLFSKRSYFLSRYLNGPSLMAFVKHVGIAGLEKSGVLGKTIKLFCLLQRLNVSHLQLSPQVLFVEEDHVYLTGLHHVVSHQQTSIAREALYESYTFFMKAWEFDPNIHAVFQSAFQKSHLWTSV